MEVGRKEGLKETVELEERMAWEKERTTQHMWMQRNDAKDNSQSEQHRRFALTRADEASLRLNTHHKTLCCEKRKKVMAKGPARYETWTKLPKQSQINKASLPKNRAGAFKLKAVFARQGGGFSEKGNCHKSLVTWVQTPVPMKRRKQTPQSCPLSTTWMLWHVCTPTHHTHRTKFSKQNAAHYSINLWEPLV